MKSSIFVATMVALLAAPLTAGAVTSEGYDTTPPSRIDMPDKSQESDCDCCQKCQAATSRTRGKEETATDPQTTGCEDCCDRCGHKLPATPQDSPPDIIDKPEKL